MKLQLTSLILAQLFLTQGNPLPKSALSKPLSDTMILSPDPLWNDNGHSRKSALQHIAIVGSRNHLPLGIVIGDQTLCEKELTLSKPILTIGEFVSEFNSQFPRYKAVRVGDVLDVSPRLMPAENKKLLDLNIKRFITRDNTHQGMGVALWIAISSQLVPQETQTFVGGSSMTSEILPGIDASEEPVLQILNLIASKGQGGVWVMDALSRDWISKSDNLPYKIIGYSDQYDGIMELACPVL